MTQAQFKQLAPIEVYKQFNKFLIQNECLHVFWEASAIKDSYSITFGDRLTRACKEKDYVFCSELVDRLLDWRGAERAGIRTIEYWAELNSKLLKEYKKVFSTQIAPKIKY